MSADENPYAPPQARVLDQVGSTSAPQIDLGLASRGARLRAVLIDTFIAMAILLPILWFSGWFDRVLANEVSLLDQIAVGGFGLTLWVVLNGYLLHTRGQTIGKAVVKVRIVRVDGTRADLMQLIALRHVTLALISLIPFVGNVFGLADVLFIFRQDRRCIHDFIAGTKVVDA